MSKNLLFSLFMLFILSACGGKPASNTTFEIRTASLVSGASALGGIALTGTNGQDSFSVGLSQAQAESFKLELPAGNWSFKAVAWLGQSDGGSGYLPISGESRCGSVDGKKIEGSEANVSLTLTAAHCSSYTDTNGMDFQTPNTFNRVNFQSCLNLPATYNPDGCNGGITGPADNMVGESLSLRVIIPGRSSYGASLSSLSSRCYNIDIGNGGMLSGFFNTDIRLPGKNIPVIIKGYEKLDCDEEDFTEYSMPGGILGTAGVAKQYSFGSDVTTVIFADNYIGGATSVFSSLISSIMPDLACGRDCYPSSTGTDGTANPSNYIRDDVRRGIWNLTGSQDGQDPSDRERISDAIAATYNHSLSVGTLSMWAKQTGSQGNSISVSVNDLGNNGGDPIIVTCTETNISIIIDEFATEVDVNELTTDIQNNCGAYVNVNIMPTDLVATSEITSMSSSLFMGGSDEVWTLQPQRREEGTYNRVRRLLLGPIGVGLANKGVTAAMLCSGSGSYPLDVPGKGAVTVKLSPATTNATMPNFYQVGTFENFERRIVLNFDGVDKEAIYYVCNDSLGDIGFGAYVSRENESATESRNEQLFWGIEVDGTGWVELTRKESGQNREDAQYSLMRLGGAGSARVDYWGMNLHEENGNNNYSHSAGKVDENGIYLYAQSFEFADLASVTEGFVVNTLDDKWHIGTANHNGKPTALTDEPNSIVTYVSSPNTFLRFKVSDLANASFWPLSY